MIRKRPNVYPSYIIHSHARTKNMINYATATNNINNATLNFINIQVVSERDQILIIINSNIKIPPKHKWM